MTDIIIPKKNIILDSQILTTLMACAQLTDFRFNLDLVSSAGKSSSLEMGSIVHIILEKYYKRRKEISRGNAEAEAFTAGREYVAAEVQNTSEEDIELVFKTMEQYFEYYRNETWIPVDVEHVKQAIIYEDNEIRILWKAKLDLTTDTDIAIMPVDHKTSRIRRDTIALNNQFRGQALLMKTRGVIINKIGFQKTLKPSEKFTRPVINYSLSALAEWSQVVVPFYAKLMLTYAETGYWPPNYTHCESKFGYCQFREVCEADINMREDILRVNFTRGPKWDVQNPDD